MTIDSWKTILLLPLTHCRQNCKCEPLMHVYGHCISQPFDISYHLNKENILQSCIRHLRTIFLPSASGNVMLLPQGGGNVASCLLVAVKQQKNVSLLVKDLLPCEFRCESSTPQLTKFHVEFQQK